MALSLAQKLPRTGLFESPTPKENSLRFQFLLLLAAVVLGASLVLFGPTWAQTILDHVELQNAAGAVALAGAVLVSVVIHEMGHFIAALSLNFYVLGCSLGPLRYERQPGSSAFWFSGESWFRCSVSAAMPREIQHGWRWRMMIVIAAGPAATLLLLVLSTLAAVASQNAFWSAAAEVNLLLFVLGLVPNGRLVKTRNDAELFRAVCRNGADAIDMRMCHTALELGLRGSRPADYPEPLMNELANFSGRPFTNLTIAKRMVEWALDQGHFAVAGAWDEHGLRASAGCGARALNLARAESGCFDLVFRNDRSSAQSKFAQVNFARVFPPYLAEKAKAAWMIASDRPHLAPAHIRRAQDVLPLGVAYYDYERAILAHLQSKAMNLCATPTPSSCNAVTASAA